MSWQGHKGTFRCQAHPRLTARARRHAAVEGRAPLCPTCRAPMELADPRERAIVDAAIAAEAASRHARGLPPRA